MMAKEIDKKGGKKDKPKEIGRVEPPDILDPDRGGKSADKEGTPEEFFIALED